MVEWVGVMRRSDFRSTLNRTLYWKETEFLMYKSNLLLQNRSRWSESQLNRGRLGVKYSIDLCSRQQSKKRMMIEGSEVNTQHCYSIEKIRFLDAVADFLLLASDPSIIISFLTAVLNTRFNAALSKVCTFSWTYQIDPCLCQRWIQCSTDSAQL